MESERRYAKWKRKRLRSPIRKMAAMRDAAQENGALASVNGRLRVSLSRAIERDIIARAIFFFSPL